jgi:hypothetical protein
METDIGIDIDQVLEHFRQGQLTEQSLRQALERRGTPAKRQDLLYLQASSTSLVSSVLGMTLVRDGKIVPGATDAAEWPYSSVLEAIRDGWRVVKFPELALLLVEERTIGLGCEFILEKWS